MTWKKIACFTDIHWGKGGDDPAHNEMCLEFVQWFAEQAQAEGCDVVAFLGDWHDARNKIGVETLNYSMAGLDVIAKMDAKHKFFVIGNHDMYFRENRDVDSLPFLEKYPGIVRVSTWISKLEDMAFVPYLVPGDDLAALLEQISGSRYVFGHFELPGFMMDGHNVMPDRPGKLGADDFAGPDWVFSGHFHKRQVQRRKRANVCYIGNCFPHDFGDAGDVSRGMMILENGKEPVFRDWPQMPSYHRARPAAAVDLIKGLGPLAARARIQLVPDPEMTRAERDAAAEEALAAGAARVTLAPSARNVAAADDLQFEVTDVGTSVVTWLSDKKNVGELDCDLLVELFREA